MTNVSPWIYAYSPFHFASLYCAMPRNFRRYHEPIIYLPQNSHHTYLLWHFHSHFEIYFHATFYRSVYYDMLHHSHIAFHDHVVDIVFVACPPFITFHTCDSWFIAPSRYTAGGIHIESYLVLALSCKSIKVWWSSLLEHCPSEERMMKTMIPPQVGMRLRTLWKIKEAKEAQIKKWEKKREGEMLLSFFHTCASK